MLTIEEATREACSIIALAYHSIGDYTLPHDGFCDKCPAVRLKSEWNFQNNGHIFDYVRMAVLSKLKEDGYVVAHGFDTETGKEA